MIDITISFSSKDPESAYKELTDFLVNNNATPKTLIEALKKGMTGAVYVTSTSISHLGGGGRSLDRNGDTISGRSIPRC